jgi:hypothetical protein
MKERPILFSAPMVRAILTGSKTQTRRVVKPTPQMVTDKHIAPWEGDPAALLRLLQQNKRGCPYGQPGERLWVRETWMPDAPRDGSWADVQFYGCKNSPLDWIPKRFRKPKHCLHRATWDGHELVGWNPSIHMPRWASRILLEIVSVRVERLQDISEEDANAEGVELERCCNVSSNSCGTHIGGCCGQPKTIEPIDAYRELWNSINGADAWDVNPWVWVVEFKRVAA